MTSEFSGRSVFVTGATGYFGTVLCQRLTALGAQVHGLSRQAHPVSSSQIKWWQADLSKENEAERLLEKIRPSIIYHLAGLPDGKRDQALVLPTFEQNALVTVRLLNAATTVGCDRFIYCSSMEEPSPFEASPQPNSPYAASKWVGTIYSGLFHELYKLPTVILRVYLTYGPGPQIETKLIPYLITSLLKKEQPRLSSGERMIDVVYIDDVIEAFSLAGMKEQIAGKMFEIGSGKSVSIKEIAEKITSIINNGISPLFDATANRLREMMPVATIDTTRKLLGWEPKIGMDVVLANTVDWFRTRK